MYTKSEVGARMGLRAVDFEYLCHVKGCIYYNNIVDAITTDHP